MGEALVEAYEQLFQTAKKSEGKNAVAFRVRKHSGSYFGTTFKLGAGEPVELFEQMLRATPEQGFVSSYMYKLDAQKHALRDAACDLLHHQIRLEAFFENNFNETREINFRDSVRDFAGAVFLQQNPPEADADALDHCIRQIFAGLRFAHFLHAKDKDDDEP